MKKLFFFLFIGFSFQFGFAQTAVNFNCNDCAGSNHDLFTELDAGNVIVLTWVMPCSACIPGAANAATAVLSYASSYPGIVKFYLADDYGTTACITLSSWATTNGITTNSCFSNPVIKMSDYGSSGMPKTIVLGGVDHTVFLNQSGTVSVAALQTAINNALSVVNGINENINSSIGLNIFPNPALNNATLNYTLTSSEEVTIEIFDELGQNVSTVSIGKQSAGKQEYQINIESLSNGVYFIKLSEGEATETIKLTISR